MKLLFSILLILACYNSFAQFTKLKGTWTTTSRELIHIEDTADSKNENYLSNTLLRDENFELFILGDTLSFQKRYFSSRTNYKKLYTDRYDLKFKLQTDSVLIVEPVSKFSKDFFQNKKELTLKRQDFATDSTLIFEKIVFHTSECFGTCSIFHLEVDSSKYFKLHAPLVFKNRSFQMDSALQGYFTGKIPDSLFNKLVRALQTSNLRTLNIKQALCCDGSIKTIIVYHNRERIYFKTMFPPFIINKLIDALYEICKSHNGNKTSEIFEIEE